MNKRWHVQKLMLDSGAFSVWNKGKEIDLDKYIAFCLKYVKEIDYIVALDVIPGKPSDKKSLTPASIECACQKGWDNYCKMIKAGLPKEKVMPVFHQNDSWKWLERFMEEKIPYFGISPANDCSPQIRKLWLDNCMKYVCDEKGMPLAKFHGFGVGSLPLILRYPWFSCDSASWLRSAMYGSVFLPYKKIDGSWDYFRPPMKIFFSTHIQAYAFKNDLHYSFLTEPIRRNLNKYLEETGAVMGESTFRNEPLGYKVKKGEESIYSKEKDHIVVEEIRIPGVINDFRWRAHVNKHYYEEVGHSVPWPRPFNSMKGGLL